MTNLVQRRWTGTLTFLSARCLLEASRPLMTSNQLLWSYEIRRLAKCRVDHPPHGITRCGELIAVAVAQIDRDPVVRDRLVELALEIAVAYRAGNRRRVRRKNHCAEVCRSPVSENAEDLAADFIIGKSVKHGRLRSRDAFSNSKPQRACRMAAPCILESYPLFRERSAILQDRVYRWALSRSNWVTPTARTGRPGGREPPAYLLFSLSPRAFR